MSVYFLSESQIDWENKSNSIYIPRLVKEGRRVTLSTQNRPNLDYMIKGFNDSEVLNLSLELFNQTIHEIR